MSLVGTLTCETNSFTYPVVVNRSKNKPRTAIDFFHFMVFHQKSMYCIFPSKNKCIFNPSDPAKQKRKLYQR